MPTPGEQHWQPIVRRARRSGGSIRAFARQHGFNENTLAWWSWRLGDRGDSAFIEVAVGPEAARPLRLHVGGVHVDVDTSSDLALLRRLVEALS